jgi:hypothetical protein
MRINTGMRRVVRKSATVAPRDDDYLDRFTSLLYSLSRPGDVQEALLLWTLPDLLRNSRSLSKKSTNLSVELGRR